MNFTPFSGHLPSAATAIPTIHQFAAKFGYEGSGNGGVVQETRYQAGSSGVQFAVAPGSTTSVTVDGVKYRQAESVVVVSTAQPGTIALAGIAPIHTGENKFINKVFQYNKKCRKCVSTIGYSFGFCTFVFLKLCIQNPSIHQ